MTAVSAIGDQTLRLPEAVKRPCHRERLALPIAGPPGKRGGIRAAALSPMPPGFLQPVAEG
jgi:hypothetical protein